MQIKNMHIFHTPKRTGKTNNVIDSERKFLFSEHEYYLIRYLFENSNSELQFKLDNGNLKIKKKYIYSLQAKPNTRYNSISFKIRLCFYYT